MILLFLTWTTIHFFCWFFRMETKRVKAYYEQCSVTFTVALTSTDGNWVVATGTPASFADAPKFVQKENPDTKNNPCRVVFSENKQTMLAIPEDTDLWEPVLIVGPHSKDMSLSVRGGNELRFYDKPTLQWLFETFSPDTLAFVTSVSWWTWPELKGSSDMYSLPGWAVGQFSDLSQEKCPKEGSTNRKGKLVPSHTIVWAKKPISKWFTDNWIKSFLFQCCSSIKLWCLCFRCGAHCFAKRKKT